jgi:hypothetical protein
VALSDTRIGVAGEKLEYEGGAGWRRCCDCAPPMSER